MVEKLQQVGFDSPGPREHEPRFRLQQEVHPLELVSKGFVVFRRNWILLLSALCIGVIGAVGAYYIINPVYKSELVLSVPALQKHELERLLVSFREKMAYGESGDFKTIELITVPEVETQSFIIGATTVYKENFPRLQQTLVDHLNANHYVKQDIELKREKIEQTLALLKSEEGQLASALDRTLNSSTLQNTEFSVAELAKLKIEMHRERIQLEHELHNLKAITIIQDFAIPLRPSNKRIPVLLGISIAASLSIAMVILIVLETLKFAKRDEPKNHPKTVSWFSKNGI